MISPDMKKYLPLSEATYYILLSLIEPRHGYGIMQNTSSLTGERLNIGPGTLYGTITKLLDEKLIVSHEGDEGNSERRKVYRLTDRGKELLGVELERLRELVANGDQVFGSSPVKRRN